MTDIALSVIILGNLVVAVTALARHGGIPPYTSTTIGLIGIPFVLVLLGAVSFEKK